MNDKILSAWANRPGMPTNQLRHTRACAVVWMALGAILLMVDGLALAHFANDWPEALILALLTMPTGLFVIACALEARK